MIDTGASVEGLDMEWLQLINEAKNLGLEKEEVRKFLQNNGVKEMISENR